MKPYPKYRDSGVELIGEIPEDWQVAPLRRFLSGIKDGTHGTFSRIDIGVPLLSAKNVFADGITISDDDSRISHEDHISIIACGYPKKGDVLLTIVGTIGRTAVYDFDEPISFQRSVAFLRTSEKMLPRFLYWQIHCPFFQHDLSGSAKTSAQSGVYLRDVCDVTTVVPQADIQAKVVSFLDAKTREIDELVGKKRKQIELLTEYRSAVISEAVTKGLNPKAKMKDSGVEWIGQIPQHWRIGGLTKFLESIVDYRGRTPEKIDDGIFLVTAKNIRDGRIDYDASQEFVSQESFVEICKRGVPEIGDVLFTTEAPLGQVAVIDRENIALAQRVIKFRPMPELLDSEFLKFWIMCNPFQQDLARYATGSTALGIKASKLNKLLLVVPPIDEQRRIVGTLKRRIEAIENLSAKVERQIESLQSYRTSLISEALTGKIDVRGWSNSNE